eukprot:2707679-Pleurochrysis_carterae.AAC.1
MRHAGAIPVKSRMTVSGCSTTTQSASTYQHHRKKAMPQKVRPSKSLFRRAVLSLSGWWVHGGQKNARLQRFRCASSATSPM